MAQAREAMVHMMEREDLRYRLKDPRVLAALRKVPRHRFVPEALASEAYENRPLPIGDGQTISQPFIVGYMTEVLDLKPWESVLEIGTGSGYQAAILGELAKEVYSIEIIEKLGLRAEALLQSLGYRNVHVRLGDGYRGWPEHAPFDAVIVTAAADQVPELLVEQLKMGGRMVIPLERSGAAAPEPGVQELVLLRKTPEGLKRETFFEVRFVPMTGEILGR
ncbi:MAG: protein-L-isoaspartate(D-aspartate) O-methyltransferase [Elusimicrobia bacterium]|nr:protein-L-isoaspartate(D-aspartate) O-methyltransferase [Elusimicrobiota bacterium]